MSGHKPIKPATTALRIVLIYAVVGWLWIYFSDSLLHALVRDPDLMSQIAMVKGWLYVLVTATLLYVLIIRALTLVEHSQKELESAETNYRTIFETSADALLLQSAPDWNFTDGNAAALRLLGVESKAGLRKITPWSMAPPLQPGGGDSRELAIGNLEETLLRGQKLFEWRVRGPDGGERSLHVRLTRMEVEGRVFVLAAIRDLTEQRRQEEALKKSEEQYRELVESANSIILKIDTEGRITFFNEFAQKFFGYTSEEILGKAVVGTIVPKTNSSGFNLEEMVRQACAQPTCYQDNENENVTRDGRTVRVKWANRAILNAKGQSVGILAVGTDVTAQRSLEAERLEMERRLLHTQKLESLGVLTGGVAHDFNNLLAAILGNLELAQGSLGEPGKARLYIVNALHASTRAADLTKQMLDYAGRGKYLMADMDVNELARDNIALFKASVPKNASIDKKLSDGLPLVHADPGQIQQVVMNLITNAAEALEGRNGTVLLSTGVMECDSRCLANSRIEERPAPGRFVFVEVSDDGVGMSQETLARLFEPFFTTKFAGRGLGMSAVLGIIRSHQGAIFVESAPGQGSRIKVLLPCVEGSAAKPADAKPGEAEPPNNLDHPAKGRVLLADDEEMVRETCAALLEHLGFSIAAAVNGEEALKAFGSVGADFSLAILDLTMPVMDGLETLKGLRAKGFKGPVILSSGYAESENTRAACEEFGARFIQKPYTMSSLKTILGQYSLY